MGENNDAPLSRFSTLCRKIDTVVETLEQDGQLFLSIRNEIEQLRGVSGTLRRMEGSDEAEMTVGSGRAYHGDDEYTESRGNARSYSTFEFDRVNHHRINTDAAGDSFKTPVPRGAESYGRGRFISHYPSTYVVEEGQEGEGVESVEGVEEVEEVDIVVHEPEERVGRTRRPEPSSARVYRSRPSPIIYGRDRDPYGLPRSPESKPAEAELICLVERAALEFDMRHPDWRTFNTDHIIVTYHRDVPNQGSGGERLDEGARIRRQGTFSRNSKRPERIRINSETLIGELEKITSTLFKEFPLVLIPPYKVLFLYWPQIQDKLSELDSLKHSDQAPEDIIKKFDHLNCLVNLIKEDFVDFLDVLERVNKKTLERISFEDLWCLFNPGDIVLSDSNGYDRAFMIYCVSGGRLRISDAESPYSREDIVYDAFRGRSGRPRGDRYNAIEEVRVVRGVRSAASGDVGSHTSLTLDCFYLDFDGEFVAPCQKTLRIGYFSGTKEINDLNIIPAGFGRGTHSILERLRKRGERLMSLRGHKIYHGLALTTSEEVVGEVYIDPETGYSEVGGWSRYNPELGKLTRMPSDAAEYTFAVRPIKRPVRSRGRVIEYEERDRPITSEADVDVEVDRMGEFLRDFSAFLNPVNPDSDSLTADQLLLLPECTFGYVFRSRRWIFLTVDEVSDINRTDEERMRGFNDLVIPVNYRQLLLALVENHARGSATVQGLETSTSGHMDLVAGKGNGLIILLHGPPGAGKTSTAETIAAYTKRPLYSITCGDIGTVPEAIERSLENHFRLANKWGCVLLLDEADVFMAKRDWHSMERNAAVSVFLRVLEYYSGILFLTTNRIGVIDEAFKSRIHVSLRYPSLDLPSTRSIWENLLNVINRDNETQAIKVEFDKDDLLSFAETHFQEHEADKTTWNGRQIRNAFQTAIALGRTDRIKMLKKKGLTEEGAEKKGKKKGKEKYLKIHLTRKNFMKIAQTANEFEEYMVNVRGSDTGVAKNELVRNDEFVPGAVRIEKVYQPIPESIVRLGQAAGSRKPSKIASASKVEEKQPQVSNSAILNNSKGGNDEEDTDTSSTSSSDDS